MRFYRATGFLFPRHYSLRLFALCFAAVHLPLVAFCASQAIRGAWDWRIFVPLLLATLIGTIGAVAGIAALLAPISQATALLRAVQHGEQIDTVPVGGPDLVGELLDGVASAAAATATRIERLADAAEKDVLTGLRNRRGFLDAIAPLLRHERNSVVAVIDLDHFKGVNDRFGHDEGDRVLTAFARRLEAGLRRSDLAARWGGEEFSILLPDTDLDEAAEIIERLRVSLHVDRLGRGIGDAVTFSCGLAIVRDYASLGEAMRKADKALYTAKRAGRDRVTSLT